MNKWFCFSVVYELGQYMLEELGQYMRKSCCSRNDSYPVYLRWCWCSSNALTFSSCTGRDNISINISERALDSNHLSHNKTYTFIIYWPVTTTHLLDDLRMHNLPRIIWSLARILDEVYKHVDILTGCSPWMQGWALVLTLYVDDQGN